MYICIYMNIYVYINIIPVAGLFLGPNIEEKSPNFENEQNYLRFME